MKTAITQAIIMYAIAFAISLMVAFMIKGLFAVVRRFSGK